MGFQEQEKQHAPTKRKLQKARLRGEVPKSTELISALLILTGVCTLWAFHNLFFTAFQKVFHLTFHEFSSPHLPGVFTRIFSPLIWPTLLFFAITTLLSIGGHLLQTGFIWTRKKQKGKRQRRILFPLLQALILFTIGYIFIKKWLKKPPEGSLSIDTLFRELLHLGLALGLAFLILGIFDYFYQKWRFNQSMRMTTQELKEELRENEGNTQAKQNRRERK
ncbi:MAG: Yop proteins translocation protein U [Chlamydiae bacterium]|nr:Yop proteins translocation protein U [Chlamydiota bacterium]